MKTINLIGTGNLREVKRISKRNIMKTINLIDTGKISVDKDLNLHVHNTGKVITKAEMQDMNEAFRGVNRIHKPMGLLFWVDVKNGKEKNWDLI